MALTIWKSPNLYTILAKVLHREHMLAWLCSSRINLPFEPLPEISPSELTMQLVTSQWKCFLQHDSRATPWGERKQCWVPLWAYWEPQTFQLLTVSQVVRIALHVERHSWPIGTLVHSSPDRVPRRWKWRGIISVCFRDRTSWTSARGAILVICI